MPHGKSNRPAARGTPFSKAVAADRTDNGAALQVCADTREEMQSINSKTTPTEHRQGARQQASNVASEAGVRSNAGLLRDKNVSPDAWVEVDSVTYEYRTIATPSLVAAIYGVTKIALEAHSTWFALRHFDRKLGR